MFTVELRANESVVCGRRELTREWQVLDNAKSLVEAQKSAAWLIHEFQEFVSASGKMRSIEYRICTDSGEVCASNKV